VKPFGFKLADLSSDDCVGRTMKRKTATILKLIIQAGFVLLERMSYTGLGLSIIMFIIIMTRAFIMYDGGLVK
jgi:hypothetical protein